ncbi:MAG TPA: hypothetical protein VHN36_15075 [Ilumatobacteraceae bacterium]|nr:hypothetical protein [Ilumatobacteraceae bacterium]
MDDASAPSAFTLLDYLLDEIRETSGLLRVADLARAGKRPWWRTFTFGLIRSPTEVSADLGLLYVGQNVDRARDHWREALSLCEQLALVATSSDVLTRLDQQLEEAGLLEVLAHLQHDAIPSPVKEMTAHLADVVDKIRECDRLVVAARSRLMLERMRDEPIG